MCDSLVSLMSFLTPLIPSIRVGVTSACVTATLIYCLVHSPLLEDALFAESMRSSIFKLFYLYNYAIVFLTSGLVYISLVMVLDISPIYKVLILCFFLLNFSFLAVLVSIRKPSQSVEAEIIYLVVFVTSHLPVLSWYYKTVAIWVFALLVMYSVLGTAFLLNFKLVSERPIPVPALVFTLSKFSLFHGYAMLGLDAIYTVLFGYPLLSIGSQLFSRYIGSWGVFAIVVVILRARFVQRARCLLVETCILLSSGAPLDALRYFLGCKSKYAEFLTVCLFLGFADSWWGDFWRSKCFSAARSAILRQKAPEPATTFSMRDRGLSPV